MQSLGLEIEWRTVCDSTGAPYEFPRKLAPCVPTVAAVYRWRFGPRGGAERIYIGEAEDLRQRIQRVLTPKKASKPSDTNFVLHGMLEEARGSGEEICLDTVRFAAFEVDGVLFSVERLANQFVRRAVEAIVVRLAEDSYGDRLLNKRLASRHITKAKKLFAALPASQRRQVLEQIQRQLDRNPGQS